MCLLILVQSSAELKQFYDKYGDQKLYSKHFIFFVTQKWAH
jgi:hypothetical protein